MMQKMQNLPGMDKMSDIFSKMNLPNMGGGKFNKGIDSMMNNNLKRAKTKERMRTKLDEKKNDTENNNAQKKSELESVNADLMEIMKQLNLDNIPDLMQQMNNQQNQNESNTPRNKKKKNKGGKKK